MISLGCLPNGLAEIIDCYGNPDRNGDFILDGSFVDTYLGIMELPFFMRLSWQPQRIIEKIQCHRNISPVLVDCLREIGERGVNYLDENDFNWYGGCFNFRKNRRENRLSVHSWGIAIDINPQLAPMGIEKHKQPQFIIDAFERRGFLHIKDDAMHFQACIGY